MTHNEIHENYSNLAVHGILTIEAGGYDGRKRQQRMLAYVVFGMNGQADAIERLGEYRTLLTDGDEAAQTKADKSDRDTVSDVVELSESVVGLFKVDDALNRIDIPSELRRHVAPGTVIAVGNYATDSTISPYTLG